MTYGLFTAVVGRSRRLVIELRFQAISVHPDVNADASVGREDDQVWYQKYDDQIDHVLNVRKVDIVIRAFAVISHRLESAIKLTADALESFVLNKFDSRVHKLSHVEKSHQT